MHFTQAPAQDGLFKPSPRKNLGLSWIALLRSQRSISHSIMDINEEASFAHKRTFMDFLDQDMGQGVYMDKIRSMISQGRHRLLIDMADLRNFNLDLTRRLIRNPGEYFQPFSDAVVEVTRNVDPKYLQEGQ